MGCLHLMKVNKMVKLQHMFLNKFLLLAILVGR